MDMMKPPLDDLDLDPNFITRFSGYLERTGWTHLDHPNPKILLFQGPLDDEQEPLLLVLPRDISFQDAPLRIAEALEVLTMTQEESRHSLMQKIRAVEINTLSETAEAIENAIASKAQTLQPIIETELINLNELINGVTEMLTPILAENIEVVSDLEPQLNYIIGNPNEIRQIILNVVSNARDAMQHGGKLIIKTRNPDPEERLGIAHGTRPKYVTLSIRDTGVGMDKAIQERIFEPLFTTKNRGMGLGLAVSREIVRQLGGNISVQSEVNIGSVVEVQFPEAPATIGTLLLVEDEKLVRELMRETLERQGYRILEASGAEEARKLSQKYSETIDVLICDVEMPSLTGPELIRQLRRERPDMKAVFLTGTPTKTPRIGGSDVELNIREGFATTNLTGTLRELIDAKYD